MPAKAQYAPNRTEAMDTVFVATVKPHLDHVGSIRLKSNELRTVFICILHVPPFPTFLESQVFLYKNCEKGIEHVGTCNSKIHKYLFYFLVTDVMFWMLFCLNLS